MPDTVTVTGKTGPDITATSVLITAVENILIDTINSVISIKGVVGSMMPTIHEFDIQSQNTVTVVKSGLDWTVTIAA